MGKKPSEGQSGGVSISGTVGSVGGDIVGRDKVVGAPFAAALDAALQPLIEAIRAVPAEKRGDAEEKLAELKQEAAKGKNANDSTIAKLVDGLVGLVPGAARAVVSAFATPILGGIDPINELKRRSRDLEPIKRRIFFEPIDPTFTGLQRVIQTYEDYIVEFRVGLSKATDYQSARLSLSEYIEKRRLTVRERTKLISALEATLEYWQRQAADGAASGAEIRLIYFIEALRSYFVGTNFEFRAPWHCDMVAANHPIEDKDFENLFTRSSSDKPSQTSIGTSIIDIARTLLEVGWKTPTDREEKLLFDANMRSLVNAIDVGIKSLEARSKTLYKSFFVLKLECTE